MSEMKVTNYTNGTVEIIRIPEYDDTSRTVTLPDGTTRPYTEQENADADARAAYVPPLSLEERLAAVEDDFHEIVATVAQVEGITP